MTEVSFSMSAGTCLYAVVEHTPDYTGLDLLTSRRDEAEQACRNHYQKVYELDLGKMVMALIEQGLAREL